MTLEETYYETNRILSDNAEPLESVRLVETYRRYLKPETVRVVLLAESHVFTSDEDRLIAIPPIDDLPGYPRQYARFVYCLGLGERDLTNDPHPFLTISKIELPPSSSAHRYLSASALVWGLILS